ncbi:Phosphoglycerol transferase MdoB [Chitinophaga terrae (ex Kim and Jung 2007)]|uniref:Phosphoglycerol transferase MdoB n=1 Tax=Chitinophaga terrae (ex Kim and Jung 2007) TaxID=408074 RepID=A0A1H3YSG6_9BACT|nr:alkaline phosphatase family protein [Chitinophaga terrae (ex Kim and Jung 2007)]GEP88459.1 sulfatase [Chitinophaga terrae (ex Kim and Jung 2007)]SEA13974.1 Phosphoglycerol transferase MdoB [Chitinophaga terrae (ex Kim and Jung 2007)]
MITCKNRYNVLFGFSAMILLLSFLVRTALLCWAFPQSGLTIADIPGIYFKGLIYDLGVTLFFTFGYALYLLFLPARLNNTIFNRVFTYFTVFLAAMILVFSFFAEFTFWGEYSGRFDFIAVDYLIYTYEVISNINQSYPLPLLIGGVILVTAFLVWVLHRLGFFRSSFQSKTPFGKRLLITAILAGLTVLHISYVSNSWAEQHPNRYAQELSKAGVYSFVSAYLNNELAYDKYYMQENENMAFNLVRSQLQTNNSHYLTTGNNLLRQVTDTNTRIIPNVIMITIESFSADFMERFGNREHITPVLDSIAKQSLLFTNMYATGTRTVRGMEALSLAVPPTPGQSIVRRKHNESLFTVGYIFGQAGYDRGFFYGGDGYFDNMNNYFGNNGYDITDRLRHKFVDDKLTSTRTNIPDSAVHFENAWGICDEDIYDAVIRNADNKFAAGKPFYDFVMTTSNHRPFTYPSGKIDIPSGSSREGAVKYTDYAIGEFLKKAASKPWFKNTVIILVADHCASSAGKNEIEISKYHIPCMILNLPGVAPQEIDRMCSQIDIYPTLFSLLHWTYNSKLYGEDVLSPSYQPRAMVSTYQKLGYLVPGKLIILSPQQKAEFFTWNQEKNEQHAAPMDSSLLKVSIANYQTAYNLFKNGGMKR